VTSSVKAKMASERDVAFYERERVARMDAFHNALKMFGIAKNMVTLACGYKGTVALSRCRRP
jgi:hypothetical protein